MAAAPRAPGSVTRLLVLRRHQSCSYLPTTAGNGSVVARALGVVGWVRNRLDGSVEALAQGPAPAVQALIDWAQRGPELARVDGVQVTATQAEAALAGFEQRQTA